MTGADVAILKWFIPHKVRRVMHPVGAAKRAVTPKAVRNVMYVRHPVGTATSIATRRALRGTQNARKSTSSNYRYFQRQKVRYRQNLRTGAVEWRDVPHGRWVKTR
jgi:hypothetical protein